MTSNGAVTASLLQSIFALADNLGRNSGSCRFYFYVLFLPITAASGAPRRRAMAPVLGLILSCLSPAPAWAQQTPGGWNGSVVIPPAPSFPAGSTLPFAPATPHFAPLPTGGMPPAPSWPWESEHAPFPDTHPRETPPPDRYQRDWSAFRQQERRVFGNGTP